MNDFEDKRIELFQNNDRKNFRQIIRDCWKLRRYSDRAVRLNRLLNIEKQNIDTFFEQLKQLMQMTEMPWHGLAIHFVNNRGNPHFRVHRPMRVQEVNNMLQVCNNFKEFKLDNVQETRLDAYIEFLEYIRDNYY